MRLERGKRRPPPGSCYLEGRPRVSQSYRKTLFLFFFLHDQNRARPLLEPESINSRQHLEDNHVFPEHFQLFKLRLDFGGQQRQWRLYYHQLRYQRPGKPLLLSRLRLWRLKLQLLPLLQHQRLVLLQQP